MHSNDIKKRTIDTLARHHIKRAFLMLNKISDQHGLRREWLLELERLSLDISFSPNVTCSRGGYNYSTDNTILKFGFNQFLKEPDKDGLLLFPEYKMLRKKEDIGSCKGNLNVVVAALVAHECAHCFQFWIVKMRKRLRIETHAPMFGYDLKETESGHGLLWQSIYSTLRTNWVNELSTYQFAPAGTH